MKKIFFIICVLILSSIISARAQYISTSISEEVYCYLTLKANNQEKKQKHYHSMKLFIYNNSRDTFFIDNFHQCIHHIRGVNYYRKEEEREFYWELLTIDNQIPKDIVVVLSLIVKSKPHKHLGKNISVVIPPDSLFVSDVFMLSSTFLGYLKGYYKLCLYYEKTGQCVAETIIKHDRTRKRRR